MNKITIERPDNAEELMNRQFNYKAQPCNLKGKELFQILNIKYIGGDTI